MKKAIILSWTIDKEWLDFYSCNMTWEEFLEWQRETEGEQEE